MSLLRNRANFLRNFLQVPLLTKSREFNVNTVQYAKRWVAPTLRELLHRRTKFKSIIYTARNTFPDWNYSAEIFAFGKRLNEDFNIKYLQAAFIDPSYVAQEEFRQQELGVQTPINIESNKNLVRVGEKLISDYVQSYLQFSLPSLPEQEILKIFDWLTSEEMFANISSHIGTKDLILCADNSPTQKILRDAFVAVVGALSESSGEGKVYNFIRDFVCTQLNQKDITEIWTIENALDRLESLCKEKELGKPEPRLLGQNAPKTVLATYYVGIYENKKMIGKGFGESIDIAIQAASLNALGKLYGIHPNQKIFNFEIQLDDRNKNKQAIEKRELTF